MSMMLPEPPPPYPTICQQCKRLTQNLDNKWWCSNCDLISRDLSEHELAARRTYDNFKRQQIKHHHEAASKDEMIVLGSLVSGQQLQAGIALAVAQGVWHWAEAGTWKEKRIWMVHDIIEVLKENNKILISDFNGVLSVQGVQVGTSTKRWVDRGDYAQAVILLGATAIDVLRQLRAPE